MTSTFSVLLDAIRSRTEHVSLVMTADEQERRLAFEPIEPGEQCPLTITLADDGRSADVAVGRHGHFDTYADSTELLVQELETVIDAVLRGDVVEIVWADDEDTCVASTVQLGAFKFTWRLAFHTKRRATRSDSTYAPYPERKDGRTDGRTVSLPMCSPR